MLTGTRVETQPRNRPEPYPTGALLVILALLGYQLVMQDNAKWRLFKGFQPLFEGPSWGELIKYIPQFQMSGVLDFIVLLAAFDCHLTSERQQNGSVLWVIEGPEGWRITDRCYADVVFNFLTNPTRPAPRRPI